jgi:hypothetical protein
MLDGANDLSNFRKRNVTRGLSWGRLGRSAEQRAEAEHDMAARQANREVLGYQLSRAGKDGVNWQRPSESVARQTHIKRQERGMAH